MLEAEVLLYALEMLERMRRVLRRMLVAAEGEQALPAGRVPHLHGLVGRGGGQPRPVRAKGDQPLRAVVAA